MKKTLFVLLSLIMLVLSAFSEQVILSENPLSENLNEFKTANIVSSQIDIKINSFNVTKENEYDVIKMNECGTMALEDGNPALPMVVRTIALPDYGDLDYELVIISERELDGEYNIKPMQQPLPEVINYTPTFVKNDAVYSSNSYFPENRVFVTEPSIMRDMRFSKIYFSPFRYNPVTKKLSVITECRIDIKINMNKSTGSEPMSMYLTEEFVGLYQEMFDNYNSVLQYKSIETRVDRNNRNYKSAKGENFSAPGDYLIIVGGTTLSEKAKVFATYKAKLGYNPVIWHMANNSSSTQIKDTIQFAYDNWTTKPVYVLIIGDADSTLTPSEDVVVMRPLWKDFNSVYSYGVKKGYIPNDHWYACLSDTNYYPDIFISRFNVIDTISLNIMINKTIKYETNPQLTGNTDWFTTYLAIGGYENGRIFDTTATRFYKNYLKPYGWTDWDSLIETKTTSPGRVIVSDSMNDGQNLVLFRGHGDEGSSFGWYGGAEQNYTDQYLATDIQAIANGYLGGFVFAPTCLAGNFAYPGINSMGCYWTQNTSTNGGVGYFGATNVSYSYYNDSMALGVARAVTNTAGVMPIREFGRVSNYAKLYMETYAGTETYFRVENYLMNTLGDPACIMYTKTPKNFIVEHTLSVETKLDTVTVTVTDNTKAAVVEATVCLYDTLETVPIHQLEKTDAAGKATFINTYTKIGTMFLSVQKQDYISYLGTVEIVEATAINEVSLNGYYKNGKVTLKWLTTNSQAISHFNIYRDNSLVKQISNTSKSYSENINENGKKIYTLEVVYKDNSVSSYKIPVTIDLKTGFMFEKNILTVTNVKSFKVINLSGQTVKEYKNDKEVSVYNLSHLSNGIYFIRTDSGDINMIEIVK